MSYIFKYLHGSAFVMLQSQSCCTFPYSRGVQTAARVQKLCDPRRVADFE